MAGAVPWWMAAPCGSMRRGPPARVRGRMGHRTRPDPGWIVRSTRSGPAMPTPCWSPTSANRSAHQGADPGADLASASTTGRARAPASSGAMLLCLAFSAMEASRSRAMSGSRRNVPLFAVFPAASRCRRRSSRSRSHLRASTLRRRLAAGRAGAGRSPTDRSSDRPQQACIDRPLSKRSRLRGRRRRWRTVPVRGRSWLVAARFAVVAIAPGSADGSWPGL